MSRNNTTLDDVACVIGFTPTLRLAAWYGDRGNLYVPEQASADQVIARLIGLPAASRLSEAFPQEYLAVPGLSAYAAEARRARIALMLQRGLSIPETARIERCSDRRVLQICSELVRDRLIDPPSPSRRARTTSNPF